ncbi:hypothetical protein [Wenzhouxiangella sediminis]|uniref:hypothetical protein n=1 Tax=Wenzhouxiangella sediminis TaxID=1792836 RepID=UPI0015F270F7|nr:hypothetical protein [Wenzhouxiangella sediminis]
MGPARGAALVVSGLSLLACLAAFANGSPFFIRLFLACLVAVVGGFAVLRLLRPTVSGLTVTGRRVRLDRPGRQPRTGEVVGLPFVSPLYVGFRWRPDTTRLPRAVGLFREQMSESDFRRLCAELRQGDEP